MSSLDARICDLKRLATGKIGSRLKHEIGYARRISLVNDGKYDALLSQALDALEAAARTSGALTDADALAVEQRLLPMQADCKKYRLLMVGHAHIDMNWMWRYDETVSITLDTFRTVLNLMREFPEFTFAQSQASTYRIVEEFEPAMLEEIRARIAAGQWEVAASTWVEADRNMPSVESVARHFLYTKRYLPKLLGIRPEALNLDYEPDTFGHHANVPDLLRQAGIRYYYHCRGEENQTLYRWRSESGAEILVYLEPDWYLGPITCDEALAVPEFCERFGTDTALNVYGVGDHGGGPTRRDIERILDMRDWPIYPRVEFGSYAQFYAAAEKCIDRIPVLTGERNPVFTGCYTTQTRIKQGNRVSEKMLFEAEGLSAFAALEFGGSYDRAAFEEAWRCVLFNQFHDIIPGSGVIDTREYAMGKYQQAFAVAATAKRAAHSKIAAAIDTSALADGSPAGTTAEGAGVGFGVEEFGVAQVSRGGGPTRVFHLFNALPKARREVVELILWDYTEDPERIEIRDADGHVLRHQFIEKKFIEYWQHHWMKLLVEAEVPALGYTTLILRCREDRPVERAVRSDPRVERRFCMELENDRIRAQFDPVTGALCSLADRCSGEVRAVDGGFRLIHEDPGLGMTSWVVGRYMDSRPVAGKARIRLVADGPLYKAYRVETDLGQRSHLSYTVSLRAGSATLDYDARCDWQETGSETTSIPQLAFSAELTDAPESFTFDIPGGLIQRPGEDLDKPSQGMISAGGVMLLCDSRYGFRGDGKTLQATLIRSAFDPDPYPEQGIHAFKLAIGATQAQGQALLDEALAWNRPVEAISGNIHGGAAPASQSFLRAEGIAVSGIKLAEDEDALIVRLSAVASGTATLILSRPVADAEYVDTLEQPLKDAPQPEIVANEIRFSTSAGSTRTLKIRF